MPLNNKFYQMKKILSLVCIALFAISCSDDDSSTSTTSATVIVKDASGDAVNNTTVYSFHDSTWEGFEGDTFFADNKVVTDSKGVAKFESLDYMGSFVTSKQETFHFSVYYELNGEEFQVSEEATFKKGDSKTITITVGN